MSKLLVIGGSGFFGKSILSAFQRGLLKTWSIETIEVVSRNASKLKVSNPELMNRKIKLTDLDITNCNYLPEAEYVIHAAASTDATNYLNSPKLEKENILAGTKNFCKIAPKFCSNSKITYISSGAVYGPQPKELESIPETYLSKDLNSLPPGKRDYAAAKIDSEKCILELANQGLQISIARCFAFVGPYLPLDQHFAIGNFLRDALNNSPIRVKTTSKVFRSYMYCDDLVKALLNLLQKSDSSCKIFNIGSDHVISIDELAQTIAKIYSLPIEMGKIHEDEVDRYIPNVSKMKQELDMDSLLTNKESIIATILHLEINNEI